jgi:hypothetical protein
MLDLQGSAAKQGPDSVGFAPKYLWPQWVVDHDLNPATPEEGRALGVARVSP